MAGGKNKEEAMCGTEGTQPGETGRPKETLEEAGGVSSTAVSGQEEGWKPGF